MVQITNAKKDSNAEYGVDIAITLSTKAPEETDFIKQENFDLANELYAKTSDHKIADDILELTSSAMSTYNPEVITEIFHKLVLFDQQSYYDALSIVQSIALSKDLDLRTKFLEDIKHVNDENYQPEIINDDIEVEDDVIEETEDSKEENSIENDAE